MNIYATRGAILSKGSSIAGSPTCCCGGSVDPCYTILPAGCSIGLCFKYKGDTDEGDGYMFDFLAGGVWPDFDGNQWVMDGVSDTVYVAAVGSMIGVEHDIKVIWKVSPDGETVENYFIVDGVESDHMSDPADYFDDGSGWQKFRIGSLGTNLATHREITGFTISSTDIANFPSGIIFKFPDNSTTNCTDPDKFYYTTHGSGTITITGATIRIDNPAPPSGFVSTYLEYDRNPGGACYPHPLSSMRCCCNKYMALFDGITTLTFRIQFGCGIDITNTWNRVPANVVPSDYEFRIYCGGEGAKVQLDVGLNGGHGPGVKIGPLFAVPNAGSYVEADVLIYNSAQGPSFVNPECKWSVRGCLSAVLVCDPYDDWDSSNSYNAGMIVQYGSRLYQSLQNSNVNHQPDLFGGWWDVYILPFQCDSCLNSTNEEVADVLGGIDLTDTNGCGTVTYTVRWS